MNLKIKGKQRNSADKEDENKSKVIYMHFQVKEHVDMDLLVIHLNMDVTFVSTTTQDLHEVT